MRAVSGGILVAVGLVLFYLITTGRLAAALAAFKVLTTGSMPDTTSQSDATSTGAGKPAVAAPLSTLTPNQNPFGTGFTPLPKLTQPAVPTLVH
jgi:hypothetical protein